MSIEQDFDFCRIDVNMMNSEQQTAIKTTTTTTTTTTATATNSFLTTCPTVVADRSEDVISMYSDQPVDMTSSNGDESGEDRLSSGRFISLKSDDIDDDNQQEDEDQQNSVDHSYYSPSALPSLHQTNHNQMTTKFETIAQTLLPDHQPSNTTGLQGPTLSHIGPAAFGEDPLASPVPLLASVPTSGLLKSNPFQATSVPIGSQIPFSAIHLSSSTSLGGRTPELRNLSATTPATTISTSNTTSQSSKSGFNSNLLKETIQNPLQLFKQLDKQQLFQSQLFRNFTSQPILSINQLPSSTPVKTEESDSEEPLLSGSGWVSKECSRELLEPWSQIMLKWRRCSTGQRPSGLKELIKHGIPEALRGEVWQLLVMSDDDQGLIEAYRILITKESTFEQNIRRDINRTFPANEYFRNTGSGQDNLYKLCKAYSIFDEEIGYCQGLTFIGAALLLHMPEEQAFVVLAKIMHDYGVRNLFRCTFEELHLRFYQLERLIEEQIPDLHYHFQRLGIEAHMYASQWFLTLFTAKFPLHLVYYILDLFLYNKFNTIFQVSLALLSLSSSDLLKQDFEGVLKYFRVQLPKIYRNDENARFLLKTALSVRLKRLEKYEKEYTAAKEAAKDPLERLRTENKRLQESNLRLEQENDYLAHDLVNSKISLRKQLDVAEDKIDVLCKELKKKISYIDELEEEKRMLRSEVDSLKQLCRRELNQAESEISRNEKIITDYKQICSQLSKRLERVTSAGSGGGGGGLGGDEEEDRSSNAVDNCYDSSNASNSDSNEVKFDDVQNSNGLEQSTTAIASPSLPSSSAAVSSQRRANSADQPVNPLMARVYELELELAQTKLALVEAECNNQSLMHRLNLKD